MPDIRPSNLLYLFSDQHTRLAMGCMGHGVVKTPHLDRLAERGVLFRNGYCNAPICVPSRASMATGRHVFDIGKWDNCKPYFGEEPSWGHRLNAQGRCAASIGKLHYRDSADPNGFDPELLPLHILNGVGMLFTICRDPMPVSRKFAHLVQTAGGGGSTYLDYDRDITARAVAWLRDEAPRLEQPWTLFVSLVCPHPPWVAPEPYYALYPHDRIDLPQAYGLGERPTHPGLEDYRQFFGIKDEFDEATLRRVIAAYYGMVSYLDDNVGKLLAALDETGLAASTRVLYTSDHGESLGEKGMMSKCNMYDESVGVPMIMAGADLPRGAVVDTPAQLLDVFPTVLDATGTAPTDEDRALPGTSLFELGNGAVPDRVVFAEQHSAGAKSAVYMVRTARHKLVHYADGCPSQLFDLEHDPRELHDVAGDPAHGDALAACETALRDLIDPQAVDAQAKADQVERLERGGGQEAIAAKGSPGYTPAPGEAPTFM